MRFFLSRMKKEKLKEGKQQDKEFKSDEVHFQKEKKKDHSKHSEEDQEKQNLLKHACDEEHFLNERESIKKQKKSQKNREHTALTASGEGMKELKRKHKDRFFARKHHESTDNFAALNEGGDFKENGDNFISGKKKKNWKEEKDNYFAQSSAETEQSVHKHDEKVKKFRKEISMKGNLKIVCNDDSVDDSKKKRKQKEKEREYHLDIGRSEKEDIDQVSERTDVVKKKKKKIDYDDNNVDDSKKKRKRKAEPEEECTLDIENSNNNQDSEDSEVVKKKKKKSKYQPKGKSKPAVHPGLSYLHTWHNDRQNWNFKKVRQVWLLHNMFDQQQISDEDFCTLLKYLEGLKGTAKDKTIEMAEQRIESGTGEQDAVVESRVRQVLQLLTE